MVALLVAAQAALLVGVTPPLVFFEPGDIEQARGVEIVPLMPESKTTLIPAEPARPSLWYSPVATHTAGTTAYIWYQRVEREQPEYSDQRTLCLGLFHDGQWAIPSVREEPVPWDGPNNVVMRRSPQTPTWGGFNVFQILPFEGNYHMVYWDQPAEGDAGAMHAVSPDGITWTTAPPEALFTEHNDAFTIIRVQDAFFMYQTKLLEWPDKPSRTTFPDAAGSILAHLQRTDSLSDRKDPRARAKATKARTEFYYIGVSPCRAYAALLMKYYATPEPGNTAP